MNIFSLETSCFRVQLLREFLIKTVKIIHFHMSFVVKWLKNVGFSLTFVPDSAELCGILHLWIPADPDPHRTYRLVSRPFQEMLECWAVAGSSRQWQAAVAWIWVYMNNCIFIIWRILNMCSAPPLNTLFLQQDNRWGERYILKWAILKGQRQEIFL